MLSATNYAQNYAGIIGKALARDHVKMLELQAVYSFLMNYPSFFLLLGCLILVQISVIDYKSAPKIMSRREKPEFIGKSAAFLWLV